MYLGICFSWNGSFVKAKKLLHDKASKAMYSLMQKGRRLNLPIDSMLKLFDSCVELILLYGCEVWGYENVDILECILICVNLFLECPNTRIICRYMENWEDIHCR